MEKMMEFYELMSKINQCLGALSVADKPVRKAQILADISEAMSEMATMYRKEL